MKSVLYKMVADIMFQIERKKLFEEIILRSQESFLQNLQISDKHINGYGVLRVLKEALKKFNIDLVLQNDFACQQGTLLHYSKRTAPAHSSLNLTRGPAKAAQLLEPPHILAPVRTRGNQVLSVAPKQLNASELLGVTEGLHSTSCSAAPARESG